jgi:hypothetical protein
MLAHVARYRARIKIIAAAGRVADDQANRLAVIEIVIVRLRCWRYGCDSDDC